MPGKAATIKAYLKQDPLVAIVGRRVDAALRWRRKSESEAAEAAGISRQAIANITSGKTKRCHRSARASIAKLCGPPITTKYLGGKESLRIPPLSAAPSGNWADALLLADLAGFESSAAGQLAEDAPQYELEGFGLGQAIKSSTDLNNALGAEYPRPDIEHTARWMVSLYLWREFLFGNQAGALGGSSYADDASSFAYHAAEAVTVLLRPWIDGRVTMRPRMLPRWARHLDDMVAEIVRVRLAQENGDVSELVIWEIAGGDPPLMTQLTAVRDAWRDSGMTEDAIAAAIRRGDVTEN